MMAEIGPEPATDGPLSVKKTVNWQKRKDFLSEPQANNL